MDKCALIVKVLLVAVCAWNAVGVFCMVSPKLREECRLRVLENRVLRRIFGPKRDEVTGMEKTT
jgi:hypothetical protein